MFQITPEIINSLIDKIRDSLMQLDPSSETDHLNDTFQVFLLKKMQRIVYNL